MVESVPMVDPIHMDINCNIALCGLSLLCLPISSHSTHFSPQVYRANFLLLGVKRWTVFIHNAGNLLPSGTALHYGADNVMHDFGEQKRKHRIEVRYSLGMEEETMLDREDYR